VSAGTAPLPGMENQAHEDVRDAALSLFGIRDEKKELKKRETDAEGKLLSIMEENSLRYFYDPERKLLVEIEEKEKIKVTIKGGGKKKDEEEDDDE